MALGDRIKQSPNFSFPGVATAIVAIPAILESEKGEKGGVPDQTIATIATIAVAGSKNQKVQPSTETVNPWGWLRPISDRQLCYAGRGQGPSCFSCKSYDGKGSSWPGLCRYPESMGRVALEIDWNVVDPGHGCGCYEPDAKRIAARDAEPDFRFNDSPFEESTGGPSCDDKPMVRPIPCREKISPVALSWLREKRQALKAAGWTMAGLYRRNRGRGLAWAGIWDIADMTATLQEGMIVIDFRDGGKVVRQTARPMPQRKLNQGA